MSLFDENAAILRKMEAGGVDLDAPRSIDFSHVFPDQASADAFAQDAEREGFAATLTAFDDGEDPWDVVASKVLRPTCEAITDTEARLDALARSHGGRADGWGFLRI